MAESWWQVTVDGKGLCPLRSPATPPAAEWTERVFQARGTAWARQDSGI